MKTQIVTIDFNPWASLIWVSRLPKDLPRGYTGGHLVRQYRMTYRRIKRLWRYAGEWTWSQDGNGTHLRRPTL